MYNVEMFEEIFAEVMDEVGANAWYELYDSEDFDIVEERIAERFGEEAVNSKEYAEWTREMYWDL